MLDYGQDQYRTGKYGDKFYFYNLTNLNNKLLELLKEDNLKFENIGRKLNEWEEQYGEGQYWIDDENNEEDTYFEITELEVN